MDIALVQVYMDVELNDELEKISSELNISKSVIGLIATYSLLSYYEAKSIFALIDIDCRKTKGTEKKLKLDLPECLKARLKSVVEEQARSMNQLILGALRSFIIQYRQYGYRIFVNVVAPKDQIILFKQGVEL